MHDLARSLWAARRRGALITFLVSTAGCFGNHEIHRNSGGAGGYSTGAGGYSTGAGGYSTGGAGGYGGGGGGATGASCAGTTPAFTVAWTLELPGGQPTTCVAVAGATMDLDVLDVATNTAYHDTFPCATMSGVGAALPPGTYSVAMRLRDAAGTLLSEARAPTTYTIRDACTTDLGSVPFEALSMAPDSYLTLTWSIDRTANSPTISCAQAGAAKVQLDAGSNTFQWPCANGKAATTTLAAGDYPVTIKLLNPQGTPLSLTTTMTVSVAAGRATDIGQVIFDLQ